MTNSKIFFYSAALPLLVSSLVACSDKPSTPPPSTGIELKLPVVPEIVTTEQVLNAIQGGASFNIIFNNCPGDDEGYDPANELLGTVKCGEMYTGRYNLEAQEYTLSGFHEGAGAVVSKTYSGPAPKQGSISVWGGYYAVDEAQKVSTPIDGVRQTVGILSLEKGQH